MKREKKNLKVRAKESRRECGGGREGKWEKKWGEM
jgi:hypothetical protein